MTHQLVVLVDRSGSMLADGKMQAVNTALSESLPHLRMLAQNQPVRVDVVTFATTAEKHQTLNLPEDNNQFDLVEGVKAGLSEVGHAIALAAEMLEQDRPTSSVLLLVSDGRPTDLSSPTFGDALQMLAKLRQRPDLVALGLGRDADLASLEEFAGERSQVCDDIMKALSKVRRAVIRGAQADG